MRLEYNIFIDYGLIIIAMIISMSASSFISSWYRKTSKMTNSKGLTGKDVARQILDKNDLHNVKVEPIDGQLTDHYDPSSKTVRLSEGIYNETSIAAISVASHECGHAIQDKDGYVFLKIRRKLVPVVNLASKLGYLAIIIGLMASLVGLIKIGIFAELIILLFQIVTLPVEFNASRRALVKIEEYNMVTSSEKGYAKKMLTSAALTYVAAVTSSLLSILRLVLLFTRRD
jgi:Zn-dependent membrane protease YugP